jgi:hypothetical protein
MPALAVSSIRPLGVDTDTESILGTLRRRWWVVPIVFAVVGGLVLLQDPETSVQPSYSRIDREYQVLDNTVVLSLLDLPNELLTPVPDLDTQLLQLSSDSEFQRIQAEFPTTSLVVQRVRPQLTLQPQEGAEAVVTLRGRIIPQISLVCTEPVADACPDALAKTVALVTNRHESALRAGLAQLTSTVSEMTARSGQGGLLQQRLEAVTTAIDTLEAQALTTFMLLREFNAEEPETTFVESVNYRFAFAAALILSMLIILQWSVIDKRLYGLRRIARTVGDATVIGHVRDGSDEPSLTASTFAIRRLAGQKAELRVVQLSGVSEHLLSQVLAKSGVQSEVLNLSMMGQMGSDDSKRATIIVAQRAKSHAQELATASDAMAISEGARPSVLLLG